jgi:signal transduction histidine kinase
LINQYSFKNEITNLKNEFSATNKEIVKNEVNKIESFILHQKEQTKTLLKANIKENVNIAHTIINEIYLQNKDKSKEELKHIIKSTLKKLRINENLDYFFIVSADGEMIVHPFLPELENTNVLKIQDPNGTLLFENMCNLIKEHKEGFYEWYWFKPNTKKVKYQKVGYLKNINGLDWFIGTGYYVDEFEDSLKKDIFNYTPKITFGQNGFIFIIDYNGTVLSHKNKELIGQNVFDDKDKVGKPFVKEMIDVAKKGSGFVTYYDPMQQSYLKTSFIKGVPDWNFLIGAGFNENELNIKIQEKQVLLNKANDEFIINMLIISIIVTTLLTFIALYISQIIQNLFIKYKNKIAKEIQKNHQKDMLIAQQSKMNALGDMIGNIAHQWRQPLSTITTASSGLLLKHEFGDLQSDDLTTFTKLIDDNAQYLSKTIEDFKEFFDQKKTKELFLLDETMHKVLTIVSSQFTKHNIQIVSNIQKVSAFGIENEMMQTLINILNNSKEAFENLKLDRKYIFIDIIQRKENICIEIKDNANGIKKNIINRIFEPYFTTKFKSQGIGIGLYMCYEIITKHFEGHIKVENCSFSYNDKHYTGAKFTINLPIPNKD